MEKKRSVGVTVVGIAFLILGLIALCLSLWSYNIGASDGFSELMILWLVFSIFLLILMGTLLLLGAFTLLLKNYFLILILLYILFFVSLASLLITGTSFYKLYSLALTIFFGLAVFYLTRPKVKAQFK